MPEATGPREISARIVEQADVVSRCYNKPYQHLNWRPDATHCYRHMRHMLSNVSDRLVSKITLWWRKKDHLRKQTFFKSDAYKFSRSVHQPITESRQDAFNKTAYCGNKYCERSTLYDESTAINGSLVNKRKPEFSSCHTIPKSSQLKDISSQSSQKEKLIWIPMPPAEYTSSQPKPYWTPGTLDEVLAFRGFCKNCDNDIFLDIDDPIEQLDNKKCFLLAFRAFSYSLWRNEVNTNAIQHLLPKILAEHEQKNTKLPRLRKHTAEELRAQVAEHQNNRNQYLSIQNRFIESIRDHTYTGLSSLVITLENKVPIRYSCAVPISHDFLGKQEETKWHRSVELPYIYVSLLKVGTGTNLVFSYFDNVPNEAGKRFFKSVIKSMERGTLARDFHYYAVLHNMGFIANPAWFYSLPNYSLLLLNQSITEHIYGVKIPWHRSARGLLAPLQFFISGRFGRWTISSFETIHTFDMPLIERLRNAIRIAVEDNSIIFHTTPLVDQWMPQIFKQKAELFKYCCKSKDLEMSLFYSIEMIKIAQRLKHSKQQTNAVEKLAWQCIRHVSIVAGDQESVDKCDAVLASQED